MLLFEVGLLVLMYQNNVFLSSRKNMSWISDFILYISIFSCGYVELWQDLLKILEHKNIFLVLSCWYQWSVIKWSAFQLYCWLPAQFFLISSFVLNYEKCNREDTGGTSLFKKSKSCTERSVKKNWGTGTANELQSQTNAS